MQKKVKNKPKINQELSVKEYKAIVRKLEMQIQMWQSKTRNLEQMLQTLNNQLLDNSIQPCVDMPDLSAELPVNSHRGSMMNRGNMSQPQSQPHSYNSLPDMRMSFPQQNFSNPGGNAEIEILHQRWVEAETQNKILVQENLDLMDQMADVRNELVAQKAHAYDLQETITELGQDKMRLQAMVGQPTGGPLPTPSAQDADEARLVALRKRNDSLENKLKFGEFDDESSAPSGVHGHRFSIDSQQSNATIVTMPDLMPFSERKQFKGKLDIINEDLKSKNHETYTVTVYETPFGMNLADDRVTQVKGPAATAGVKVGSQIQMVNGERVDAETWFDAYCNSNIPFTITFKHRVTRTEKYKEILAKCEQSNDEQGRRALFFRIIASEKKTRQKLDKARLALKESKMKINSSDRVASCKDELVENTRAQLQQMEQLARLSQQMHIEERSAYEKELTDKADEITKLRGHLKTIMQKLRGKKRGNPLADGGHIRRPIASSRRQGSQVMSTQDILEANRAHQEAKQGKSRGKI